MTIEKNIAFPLSLRHIERADARRRVGEALELVRLTGFERRYPSQLSGGQQRRVALARAVVFRPRVLLMDEPLGALDAGLRAHLQREIVRIGRELGVTILYVTHDQDEALSMSDQIVLFHNGSIDQAGSPRDIYTAPRTAFAASFLGTGALIDGCLENESQGPLIRTASGLTVPVDPASVAAQHLTVGRSAAAVLRPECVSLHPTDTVARIGEGTVDDIIYTGSRVRISVDLGNGHRAEYHCDANLAGDRRLGDRSPVFVSTRHLPAVVPFDIDDTTATPIDTDTHTDTDPVPDSTLAMAGEL
jgi:ABC-type Fe3+/spermidine/putrescine transport system ATPase subunit